MTVTYSQRTVPLAANSSSAVGSAVALAFDFTGMGSLAEGQAYLYQGATRPALTKTGTQSATTRNGIPGRTAGTGSSYDYTNTTDFGLQVGTGDFTVALIFSTASALPTSTAGQTLMIATSGGTATLQIGISDGTTGWYTTIAGLSMGTSAANTVYGVDSTVIIWVRRLAGVISAWTQLATSTGTPTRRYNDASSAGTLDSTSAARLRINYNSSGTAVPTSTVHSLRFWRTGLSDAQLAAAGQDWWALDSNSVPADSLTITSPTAGASIPTTTTITGTYTGNAPTGVDVQHGSGSWVTGTGFTAAGGVWSASVVLPAASAAALRARYSNSPGVVSADITGITITASSIAFTVPPTTDNGAVPYRIFQRNGSNQASVRITGTYSGSPSSIQYSFNGSAWATLVGSPSGGTFDATVTLQGPAQGALSVRFANDTTVSASLSNVGVGDVWIVGGQSNNVGMASNYVPSVAPAAHPGWVSTEWSKAHSWRPNVESSAQPFDDRTGLVWSVQNNAAVPGGSYFGALATLAMAAGVPVAFVPCALGSTTLGSWAVPSTINDPTSLYGAMVAAAQAVGPHAGVIWYQGEAEAGGSGSPSTYATDLAARIDAWYAAVGSKWFIVGICSTGTGASFATVQAAQQSVAASNPHVLGYANMDSPSPAFTGSIHYNTITEINTVANRIAAALGYSALASKAVSLALTTDGTTPAAALSGLRWAFFDQATVDTLASPSAKGSGASTNASGLLVVDVTASTLASGQTGWLIVTDSDGTTTQSPSAKAFSGPVVVT